MGLRAFFSEDLLKKTLFHCMIDIIFSHFYGSMGEGSEYLIHSLFFRLHILMGAWGQERGGAIVGTEAWGQEHGNGKLFYIV